MRVNSYDPEAKVPRVGSRWVWEIDKSYARALVEVIAVRWNGEEWWVWTKALLPDSPFGTPDPVPNDLSRFMEACTPVGGTAHSLLEQRAPVTA